MFCPAGIVSRCGQRSLLTHAMAFFLGVVVGIYVMRWLNSYLVPDACPPGACPMMAAHVPAPAAHPAVSAQVDPEPEGAAAAAGSGEAGKAGKAGEAGAQAVSEAVEAVEELEAAVAGDEGEGPSTM